MGAALEKAKRPKKKKKKKVCETLQIVVFLFVCFCLFRAIPVAYGGSQARGQIGAVASGHSHSHARSKPRLQSTLQLTATLDP